MSNLNTQVQLKKKEREELWQKMRQWEKENGEVITEPSPRHLSEIEADILKEMRTNAEANESRRRLKLNKYKKG